MKFWARVSISALLLALSSVSLCSLGRFLFTELPQVPGLELESTRVRVSHAAADSVYFSSPLKNLKVKRVENGEAIYQGQDYVFAPGAIRYSPWRPGVELYFPLDIRLIIKTDLSPYLTWADGSVGAEVPAAPSQWFLLNFRDGQAPLMLVFEQPVQLIVNGDSGNWVLSSSSKFKGWVRVLSPIGPKRVASNVAALGELAKKVKPLADQLCSPAPTLVNFEARSDSSYLTSIWTFDQVGAMVPPALLLCRAGGYETRIQTGLTPVLSELVEGPVAFSKEPRIVVRFPMRRIASGRSLMVGEYNNLLSSASGFDVPSVVELALSYMSGGQDSLTQEVVSTCRNEFQRSLTPYPDLVTGVNSLVPSDGSGMDLLASHALLQVSENRGSSDILNRLLTHFDPWTWDLSASSRELRTRSTGIFALAGAFSDDSILRSYAAMAQAGMVAHSVLGDYAQRRSLPTLDGKVVQPLTDVRKSIYSEAPLNTPESEFVRSLCSPVRIISGPAVAVEKVGDQYILSWSHKQGDKNELLLITQYPFEVEAKENLLSVKPSTFLAETRLLMEAKGDGICKLTLRLPPWALDLPPLVPSPRYTE